MTKYYAEYNSLVLNQAVKRNKKRFPDDFMFQLTRMETESLVSQNVIPLRSQIVTLNAEKAKNKEKIANLRLQIVISKNLRGLHVKYLPYVFTEQGVAMLSSVLKSERAIEIHPVKYAMHPVGISRGKYNNYAGVRQD